MRKLSITIIGLATLLSLLVLIKALRIILPFYYPGDWMMILWMILPLLYFGFFFVKLLINRGFYDKFRITVKIITFGLILSSIVLVTPWIFFYLSNATDNLGIGIFSIFLVIIEVILIFIASLIALVFDYIKNKKKL